jgi:hypothetical protein
MNYSQNEGREALNRVKLLMNYSLDKTLNENISDLKILTEQSNADVPPTPQTSKKNWEKDKRDFMSKNPDMVWDPNAVNTSSTFQYQPPQNNQSSDYFSELRKNQIRQANIQQSASKSKGKWVKINPKNVELRGVPFGFHPLEYPEYLRKVDEINKKYPDEKFSLLNPTTWVDNSIDDKRKRELENLKKEYFHEEFPFGITKEDYQDWLKAKKTISDEQAKYGRLLQIT